MLMEVASHVWCIKSLMVKLSCFVILNPTKTVFTEKRVTCTNCTTSPVKGDVVDFYDVAELTVS